MNNNTIKSTIIANPNAINKGLKISHQFQLIKLKTLPATNIRVRNPKKPIPPRLIKLKLIFSPFCVL